jgi:hypothetical protein
VDCGVDYETRMIEREKNKTSEMASDVVALSAGGGAVSPLASETKIVGALPAYVLMA